MTIDWHLLIFQWQITINWRVLCQGYVKLTRLVKQSELLRMANGFFPGIFSIQRCKSASFQHRMSEIKCFTTDGGTFERKNVNPNRLKCNLQMSERVLCVFRFVEPHVITFSSARCLENSMKNSNDQTFWYPYKCQGMEKNEMRQQCIYQPKAVSQKMLLF